VDGCGWVFGFAGRKFDYFNLGQPGYVAIKKKTNCVSVLAIIWQCLCGLIQFALQHVKKFCPADEKCSAKVQNAANMQRKLRKKRSVF